MTARGRRRSDVRRATAIENLIGLRVPVRLVSKSVANVADNADELSLSSGDPAPEEMMPTPHIQVVLAQDRVPTSLHAALQQVRATTSFWPLAAALRDGVPSRADLTILVTPAQDIRVVQRLEVCLDRLADAPRPTMVVGTGGNFLRRPSCPEILPVTFVSEPVAPELVTRIHTLLEMRASVQALAQASRTERTAAARAAQQYQNQLHVASRVQRALLQTRLASAGPVRVQTLQRSREAASTDACEIVELSANELGFVIADARGADLPAALLSVFVRRALRTAYVEGDAATSLAARVLEWLNAEVRAAGLPAGHDVAATCGVVRLDTRVVTVARAGAPDPLIRRADGRLERVATGGADFGATAEVATAERTLANGDALVVFSDGLAGLNRAGGLEGLAEAFQAAAEAAACGVAGGVAAHDDGRAPLTTAVRLDRWQTVLKDEGAQAAIEQAGIRFDTLRRLGEPLDDLTLAVFEVNR